MKSYNKELLFNITERMDFVNITPEVETCIRESEISEGLCLVNAMHINMPGHKWDTMCYRFWRTRRTGEVDE